MSFSFSYFPVRDDPVARLADDDDVVLVIEQFLVSPRRPHMVRFQAAVNAAFIAMGMFFEYFAPELSPPRGIVQGGVRPDGLCERLPAFRLPGVFPAIPLPRICEPVTSGVIAYLFPRVLSLPG